MNDPGMFRAAWTLDPSITFLNHGSYGACPRAVLEAQSELRARLESEPVQFMSRELEARLDQARSALATFLGADPEGLAFVTNATEGVNTVLQRIDLRPGDVLLTTDHAYGACKNILEFVAAGSGASVVVARVPFPLRDAREVVAAILAALTPRTRVALIDHVTSPTGLIFPIEEIVAALAARGVDTLVDGAHAPGMIPLQIDRLGAAYYTGNCHKWLCAPKGSAFLYARADRRGSLRPLAISWGASSPRTDRSRYRLEHDWTGTFDPTAALSVPVALEVMGRMLPGGWPALMAHNRALALEGRAILLERLGLEEPAPASMIGSLASIPLPDRSAREAAQSHVFDPLASALFTEHRIEVPVFPWPAPPKRLLRLSAQLYNLRGDYVALADALARKPSA